MFKIALQSLLASKLRLVTTALAVIIGVAFTAGTLMLTDSMGKTFSDLSAGAYKVILAGLAGVAAAILPSRRAAKLNVLRAIVTE